jgi:hypothetical protein
MSLSLVHSRALLGLEARPVCVEVHLANGLPSFTLVGLADTGVKEARERVRSAIANAGLEFPSNKRIKCSQPLFLLFEQSRDCSIRVVPTRNRFLYGSRLLRKIYPDRPEL